MINVRKLAVLALLKVEQDGAYSNLTLNNIISENSDLSSQDKALLSTIFYGVLDRKITIDFYISRLIDIPFKKIHPFTICVLRSALYQIKYLDRIPDSAAVNEAVKIIKSSKQSYQSGFVNAVLRRFLREEINLPTGDTVEDLSIYYSCPEWITGSFIKDYGIAVARKLLEESLKTPPVYIRVNTLKTNEDTLIGLLEEQGVKVFKTEIKNCLRITEGITVKNNELFNKGFFHIQDMSSQMCAALLNCKKGETVLDLCSAPGGKSFTIAQLMENKGEIHSCDLYEHRTKLVGSGAERLGINIIKTHTLNSENELPFKNKFDAVLCDVPCSGLGIIRRKPDIKYNAVQDYAELSNIQFNILENAAGAVKKGGRIVYSTCTLRKAENRKLVDKFLKKYTDFELVQDYTYMPHIDGTDGFYNALLVSR